MFSDIANHWASQCIQALAKRKIVRGYPNGTFRPLATVTRSEFAALMPRIFEEMSERQAAKAFRDVPKQHWAHEAVAWVSQRDLFSGFGDYADGSFRPRQAISRAQAIAAIITGLQAMQGVAAVIEPDAALETRAEPAATNNLTAQSQYIAQYFRDAADIPIYAQESIAAALEQQLLESLSQPRFLRPNQAMTRGEVAALLCRALAIPLAEMGQYPALADDQQETFERFLQQEATFDASRLAFLDSGIERSRYRSDIAQYAKRLQDLSSISAPLNKTAAYPKIGKMFFVNESGLEFLPSDILSGCVCLSTVQADQRHTRWLGRDALSDYQLWSATKFIPLLNTAARANAIAPTVAIDQYRIRAMGTAEPNYTFDELASGIINYSDRIATSNALAVTFKNFETPERLEAWTQQMSGNQALSFQGRYGEAPFIEHPELWNPLTNQTALRSSAQRHDGQNLMSTYDLTRLITMAAWHSQIPKSAQIPDIQGHSLAPIIRAMGVDTARYVDVALETLGLADWVLEPVIISKCGFGRSEGRNQTELTYCALAQFSLPRHIARQANKQTTAPAAPDFTASYQQYSLGLTLIAAQNASDPNQEARYVDALMASAVTEIIRRAVLETL
ncbi:MAG: hypothetical protein DCF15_04635 [Phormidesmis priestleyi]|uniref:SLH domain-containing protein n=1 Tax=Phormidesmis priestleyi TaxID=268141 RepID=A0A2W4XML4_9CYAN|nr:MAG: hypothetical protein DCF15_04635 [Phormidesmis priestleyi]